MGDSSRIGQIAAHLSAATAESQSLCSNSATSAGGSGGDPSSDPAPAPSPNPVLLSADYVVLGSGALGLGFADALLNSDPTATIICVDKYDRPGGHWLYAYPFVRLHQPSSLYGACSLPLGSNFVETHGRSKGMVEMATSSEILAYFDKLYREVLLPTQRFTLLSLHELDVPSEDYLASRSDYSEPLKFTATSLATGKQISLMARKKFIDTTYEQVTVPSQRSFPFGVDAKVNCIKLGDLPATAASGLLRKAPRICVLGAGKTGIDAVLWLVDRGISPDHITWVVPREQLYYPREALNPLVPAFQPLIGKVESETRKAVAECTTPGQVLDRLLASGGIVKLSPDSPRAEMFHGCSVTFSEMDAMRSIKDVVRLGRCSRITEQGLEFPSGGFRQLPPGTLYVDGTNPGVAPNPPRPVFSKRKVTVQMVLRLHPTFSAALIGRLESDSSLSDEQKNAMSSPLAHCDQPWEILLMRLVSNRNAAAWMKHEPTRNWLAGCRLFGGWLKAKPARGDAGKKGAEQIVKIAEEEDEKLARLVEMARRGEGL